MLLNYNKGDIHTSNHRFQKTGGKNEFENISGNGKNYHLLEWDKSKEVFVWKESKGSISVLSKYCQREEKEEKCLIDNNEQIIIISSEAGMGKSYLMDNLYQQCSNHRFTHYWKIRINLIDHSRFFQDLTENTGIDVRDTFMTEILHLTDTFERQLFKYLSEEKRIILILDGFDEIIDYKDKALDFFKRLNDSVQPHKLIITTRDHIRHDLENRFGVLSYEMKPFVDENKKEFLLSYWKSGTSYDDLKRKAGELMTRIDSKLIENPLQLRIFSKIS